MEVRTKKSSIAHFFRHFTDLDQHSVNNPASHKIFTSEHSSQIGLFNKFAISNKSTAPSEYANRFIRSSIVA